MKLTVAYITFRKENRIEWFVESLERELKITPMDYSVVVVDYHQQSRASLFKNVHYTPPKPSVWQGEHRLTSKDYFAAANARNTALCYAEDGWIAYVDDLSILMPGWLTAIQRAMSENYIALGAYKKVKNLALIDDPERAKYEPFEPGVDSRWKHGGSEPVRAGGSWMYGCSVAMPVEALLSVNGWMEDCDSLGSEDYCTGIALEKAGYSFRYDRSMLTLESEEGHHTEPSLPRFDKGVSPNDKSHAILARVMKDKHPMSPDYIGGGIRAERNRVLRGMPFTIPTEPSRDWYDGTPLSEY